MTLHNVDSQESDSGETSQMPNDGLNCRWPDMPLRPAPASRRDAPIVIGSRSPQKSRTGLRNLNGFHSDFHVTVKLAPSEARADGTAVRLLPLRPFLVEMDSCTASPKSVIVPEIAESVAASVPPLTLV
jgi:hypothetical protein